MKFKVTGRGVYDAKGELVKPGTVLDVKTKGDKVPGYLVNKGEVVGGKETAITNPAKDALPAKSVDEVLAMADDSNVQFMTFKSEASKILGDDTPSKKDEIIAALKAKQAA